MPKKPPTTTLGDVIRFQGRARPNHTALKFEGRQTTYAELNAASNRVANALIAGGLKPGGRVAHIGKNSDRYFELLFGVAKAGGVLVGINWRLSPAELAFVIADSNAQFAFVDEEFFGPVQSTMGDLKKPAHPIAMSGSHPDWPAYKDWRDAHSDDDPAVAVSSEDVVVQMYTSGTTGKPKGAQIRHSGIMLPRRRDHMLGPWAAWDEDDVQLVCTPMFHVSGCVWATYGIYAGAPVVIHREFDVERILTDIPGERITRVIFVPAMLLMILQQPNAQKTDFSSLRTIYYGASPMPLDLLNKSMAVFGCDFVQIYGLTETSGAATYLPPGDHRDASQERLRSVGRPYPGTEVRIVDESGHEMPAGTVGEIQIKTDVLMAGYWQREADNAEAMTADGWFKTGDAGYVDEAGYLFIYDRVKDMIISGGENIYPAEVESVLHSHPAVRDAAVIGVPSENWGEAVKAIVVVEPEAQVTEAELIAYTREHMAHYKCPSSVEFVETLPRNAAGKLLKRQLRKPYWAGHDSQII